MPVTQTEQGLRFEGAGEIVEWAVQMQRLPESATLHDRLQCDEVDIELVKIVGAAARRLSPAGSRVRPEPVWDLAAVAHKLLDIYRQAEGQRGLTISDMVFERLRALTQEELECRRVLIEARARLGPRWPRRSLCGFT